MKNKFKLMGQITIVLAIIFSFQACTLKVPLKTVSESENVYVPSLEKKDSINVSFNDGLGETPQIVTGIFEKAIFLEKDDKSLEAYHFMSNAIKNELQARKLPINFDDKSKQSLILKKFEIFTHRSSGFSPIVTISMLKVTANIGNEEKVFTSVVKRGKVPIWAPEEIIDPCFNEPIMLMVKEVVAKINKAYFNYQLSDKKVTEIINKIETGINSKDSLNYINMYELGFSNNEKALDFVKSYNNNSDEYLRLASIAVLGLLGGEKEFLYLTSIYRNAKLWQDRAMALKAIADIGTEESKKFIELENNLWQTQDTKEGKWNNMILKLYEKN
ncbi:hypothetical protein LXN10_07145 [Arcobacter sp. KX21116]|jgi:hypothetical protein|uniref:HEAT repeat domain-containing protein n=1 Tax=Arcobacter iocasae TaxID=2906515 RepID=UPI0035D4B73F|tara:strand:+ start:180 stop:1169 length:990 start_codon:yes stop_codon:yes gene_type:complete